MSYLVLARKHRPQQFEDVIGQEHVTDLLKKAIEANRIAHAYLFCGPRGVGKTTCARILSLCLNCEGGPKVDPDLNSSVCQEILKGTSFDVLEIDGASNRGIDEIRSLRENVKFAPSYGKFKIYIVDEVHMLTQEAFNALLKTLEEPPEHVKFIFATTAPNKLPATIISRCQRFDFKRIQVQTIVDTLEAICKKEKFKIDSEALFAIAKAAKGSLRDALSILDQLSALSDQKIKSDDVFSMLGLVETQYLFELTDSIAQKNCPEALKVLNSIIEQGKDVKQLTRDLTEHFRNLMIIKVGGKSLGKLVDYPVAIKEMILTQCNQFELGQILRAIDRFVAVQDVARITESQRLPLEVALADLTYSSEADILAAPESISRRSPQSTASTPKKAFTNKIANNKGEALVSREEDSEPEEIPQEPSIQEDNLDAPKINIDKIVKLWDALTHAVSKEKMSVATYLQDGAPLELDGSVLTIVFSKEMSFHKESLETEANVKVVETSFSKVLKQDIRVKYKTAETEARKKEEPVVDDVLNTFKGAVVNRWHNDGES